MPTNVNSAVGPSIQPAGRTAETKTDRIAINKDGSSSSAFAKQTDVKFTNSVDNMSAVLDKIANSRLGTEAVLPKRLQEMINNVVRNAFSLENSLGEGLGSAMASERYSAEQLTILGRIFQQLGNQAEANAVSASQLTGVQAGGSAMAGELTEALQLMMANIKNIIGESALSGNTGDLELVQLNKLAFQLLNSGNAEGVPDDLARLLQLLSGQLAVSGQSGAASSQGNEDSGILKQLVDVLFPKPLSGNAADSATGNMSAGSAESGNMSSGNMLVGGAVTGNMPEGNSLVGSNIVQGNAPGTGILNGNVNAGVVGGAASQVAGENQQLRQNEQVAANISRGQQAGNTVQVAQPQNPGSPVFQPSANTVQEQPVSNPFPGQQAGNTVQVAQPQNPGSPVFQPSANTVQEQPASNPFPGQQAGNTAQVAQPQNPGSPVFQPSANTVQEQPASNPFPGQQAGNTVQVAQPQNPGSPVFQPSANTVQEQPASNPFSGQQAGNTVQVAQPQNPGSPVFQPSANTVQEQPASNPFPGQQAGNTVQVAQPQNPGGPVFQPSANTVQEQPASNPFPGQQAGNTVQVAQPQNPGSPVFQPSANTVQEQPASNPFPGQQAGNTAQVAQPQNPGSPVIQPFAKADNPQGFPQFVREGSSPQGRGQAFAHVQSRVTELENNPLFRQIFSRYGYTQETGVVKNPVQQAQQSQLANNQQTVAAFKDMAQLLLKDSNLTAKDAQLLQDFVNGSQEVLSQQDAKQLNMLLRMVQSNIPAVIQQAGQQQGMDGLPKLWAFLQLAELGTLKNIKARDLKNASREIKTMLSSMKGAVSSEGSYKADGQKSISFVMPLYIGENEQSYPAYVNLYHEPPHEDERGRLRKDTWFRVCVLTENIGAVDIVCQLYEGNNLNLRVRFSDQEAVQAFSEYLPDIRKALYDTSVHLNDLKVGTVN